MLKYLFIKKLDGKSLKNNNMKEKTKNVVIGVVEAAAAYGFAMLSMYEVWQQNVALANWKFLLPLACAIVFLYIAIQRIPQWIALMGFMAVGVFWAFSFGEPDKTPVMIAAVIAVCSTITYSKKDADDDEKSDDGGENL